MSDAQQAGPQDLARLKAAAELWLREKWARYRALARNRFGEYYESGDGYRFGIFLGMAAIVVLLLWLGKPEATSWGWPSRFAVFCGLFCAVALAAYCFWRLFRRRHSNIHYAILGGLGLLTIIVSTIGYWDCADGQVPLFRELYHGVLLISGDQPSGCEQPPSLLAEAARYLALVVLLGTVIEIVLQLTASQLSSLRARWAKNVTLVSGLNENSLPVIEALIDDPDTATVVVFEPDPDHLLVKQARRLGALVIVSRLGHRSEEKNRLNRVITFWGKVGLRRAYLLSDDDGSNVAAAELIEAALRQEGLKPPEEFAPPPRAIVRIDNYRAARHYLGQQAGNWPDPKYPRLLKATIGANQQTARAIVQRALENHLGAELVIVGDSHLSDALSGEWRFQRQAAALLVESADAAFPHSATDQQRAELNRQVELWKRQARCPGERKLSTLAEAKSLVAKALDKKRMVVLAGDPQDYSVSEIAELAQSLNKGEGVLYAPQKTQRLIAESPLLGNLYHYGISLGGAENIPAPKENDGQNIGTQSPLVGVPQDSWFRAAQLLHENYRAKQLGPRSWDEIGPEERQSNYRSIWRTLQMLSKASFIWEVIDPAASPVSLAREELKVFVPQEHNDWVRFKLSNGWAPAPLREENNDPKKLLNVLLYSWEYLSGDSKGKESSSKDRKLWKDKKRGVENRTLDTLQLNLKVLKALGFCPVQHRFERVGEVEVLRIAEETETWQTPSGTELTAEAGDYIITDGKDERSIKPESFKNSYELIAGKRYRRKGSVRARPAVLGEVVETQEGRDVAVGGQWLVTDDDGHSWLVPEESFRAGYRKSAQ